MSVLDADFSSPVVITRSGISAVKVTSISYDNSSTSVVKYELAKEEAEASLFVLPADFWTWADEYTPDALLGNDVVDRMILLSALYAWHVRAEAAKRAGKAQIKFQSSPAYLRTEDGDVRMNF
jgi:hypothetical protein